MSLMHAYEVTDQTGTRHKAHLADCLNVQRTPTARVRILAREFHRLVIDGLSMQIEKAFIYLDLARGQAFLVQPPRERYRYATANQRLNTMLALLPAPMREQAHQVRVVFGAEELREKLVAAEAGFDDRAIELMKCALIHDHPVLITRARLRLSLDAVDVQGAWFLAQYDHSPKTFRLCYALPEQFCRDEVVLRRWSASMQRHDLYALPARNDHWVNYRRWVPSQDAMSQLNSVVLALAQGKPPASGSAAFKTMLKRLPRGSALSSQAKTDLRKLFLWAKKTNKQALQDQLFELRFGIDLEDAWYQNSDKNDIDTLWRLLKKLPDSHVEGNTKLSEINLGQGVGGGLYSSSRGEIEIGSAELAFKERFEDTLRHEVGHAVHEANPALVDGWLWERFGWASFEPTDAGIEDWLRIMGAAAGYAELTEIDKARVRALIKQACGPGEQWKPTVTPNAPNSSPWRLPACGARLAFEQSGEDWYANHTNWLRANGHAFAMNFWYGTLMCVKAQTLEFINQHMPDPYAAMSPAEFFAEMYALYYDLDDPQRSHIPADVKAWMDAKLGPAGSVAKPARPRSLSNRARGVRPGRQAS